jgi:Nuclease-related domain
MIVKEHVAAMTQDRLKRAGDDAERQMAFYLRRAFADDARLHIFHNLRLEAGSEQGKEQSKEQIRQIRTDAAQIDHLILHRSGAVIIESKSVTGAVRINERDEWTRQWNGHWTGMPSPVLQARRQADFLRGQLQARRENLLGRAMFGLVQKGFRAFVIDVVVAISDDGVIERRGQLPEVRKADQVVDRVRELIQEQTGLAHPLSKDPRAKDWGVTLSPDEFVRVSAFLRSAHREPDRAVSAPQVPQRAGVQSRGIQLRGIQSAVGRHTAPPTMPQVVAPNPDPAPSIYEAAGPVVQARPADAPRPGATHGFRCQACSGSDLEVTYGKYGYYFKCRGCESNTRIELSCPCCNGRARTRKSGLQFYAECAGCSSSRLYFVNPA